ncbi:histidine kinase [Maribellus maritimus]|uniref:histidine kinase n=1 Tax=Maribellus maritimus TaxID=2870838 RepID=UPI001EEB2875|nr:histidine kinase [Maribellus maritimus]MCG6186520.1 histidine kinase [Maribellus maritimus]
MRFAIFLIFIILLSFSGCKKLQKENPTNCKILKDSIVTNLMNQSGLFPDSTIKLVQSYQLVDSLASDSNFFFSLQQILAQSSFFQGNIDSSIYFFSECYRYWEKDSSKLGKENQAKIIHNIGFLYQNLGDIEKALNNYNEITSMAEIPEIYKTQVTAYLNKSNILMDQDDYANAIESVEKCIEISDKYKDSTLMISSLQAYADLYTNCGFFDEAKQQFQEVLKYETFFTPLSHFVHHNNKGRMFFLENDYDNAKQEFLLAHEISKELNTFNQFISVMNLLELLLTQKNTAEAKNYLNLLDEWFWMSEQIPAFLFNCYSLKAEYNNQMGNLLQAKEFFQRADSVLKQNEIDNVIRKLHYKRTSNYFCKIGNYHKAFYELAELNKTNSNILQTDNRRQVAALKHKYQRDTTLIAQKNALKNQEEKITSYRFQLISLIGFSLMLMSIGVIAYLYYRKNKQLEIEKNMRKVAALKMENIRGRLSPHLIFNTINSIQENIENKETSTTQFDNLTRIIRQSLVNTEKTAITLREEICFVKSFIGLQQTRARQEFSVYWRITRELDDELVPGMILQIPVENAIKHGFVHSSFNNELTITAKKETNFLILTVADNGIGIHNAHNSTRGTGTGLKVLTNTIHNLNLSNKKKMSFEILNNGVKGTKVIIRIPVTFNYN